MANISKRLCSGTLPGSNTTLYTVPSSTYTIVKSVVLCNTSGNTVAVSLKLDGKEIISAHDLAAYDSLIIPNLDQIIESTELIQGFADTGSVVDYCISGIEVT